MGCTIEWERKQSCWLIFLHYLVNFGNVSIHNLWPKYFLTSSANFFFCQTSSRFVAVVIRRKYVAEKNKRKQKVERSERCGRSLFILEWFCTGAQAIGGSETILPCPMKVKWGGERERERWVLGLGRDQALHSREDVSEAFQEETVRPHCD